MEEEQPNLIDPGDPDLLNEEGITAILASLEVHVHHMIDVRRDLLKEHALLHLLGQERSQAHEVSIQLLDQYEDWMDRACKAVWS